VSESWWEADAFAERLEEKLAQLGTRLPRCSEKGCDETCPFMLSGTGPDIYCYEHDPLRKGLPWWERHHLAGRHNDTRTVLIPGNDHRILSELQLRWPRDTLRNPDGSPLLRAAALVRGYLDVLFLVLVLTAGVPLLLEDLDAWLVSERGERWWDDFESWRNR
jgi:hypothetical protein